MVTDAPAGSHRDLVASRVAWLLWGIPMALGVAALVWPAGWASLLAPGSRQTPPGLRIRYAHDPDEPFDFDARAR